MKIRLNEPLTLAAGHDKTQRHEPGEILDVPDEIGEKLVSALVGRRGLFERDKEGKLVQVAVAGIPLGDGAPIYAAERLDEQKAPPAAAAGKGKGA